MVLEQEQIKQIEKLVDEAWTYIEASMQSGDISYVLKGINDEIKASGLDHNYDLNAKGQQLQNLYEALYEANRDYLESKR